MYYAHINYDRWPNKRAGGGGGEGCLKRYAENLSNCVNKLNESLFNADRKSKQTQKVHEKRKQRKISEKESEKFNGA